MAQALLQTMSRDQQEWENQFGYERFVHDCISREKYAYSQGERQGEQRGIQQGLQQGEHNARLETARRMLEEGLSLEQTARLTQLPLEEVRAL